jgi:hypothetical protein
MYVLRLVKFVASLIVGCCAVTCLSSIGQLTTYNYDHVSRVKNFSARAIAASGALLTEGNQWVVPGADSANGSNVKDVANAGGYTFVLHHDGSLDQVSNVYYVLPAAYQGHIVEVRGSQRPGAQQGVLFMLLDDGRVGKLLSNNSVVFFPTLTNIRKFEIQGQSDSAVLAIRNDGTLVGNDIGWVPSTLANVVDVSIGTDEFYALRSNGKVKSWGGSAVDLPDEQNYGFVKIASSYSYSSYFDNEGSIGLRSDGTVYAWGSSQYLPDVSSLHDVIDVAGAKNTLSVLRKMPIALMFDESTVVAGSTQALSATIYLDSPRSSDTFVQVTSQTVYLEPPVQVTVPAGQVTATFDVVHYNIASDNPNFYINGGLGLTALGEEDTATVKMTPLLMEKQYFSGHAGSSESAASFWEDSTPIWYFRLRQPTRLPYTIRLYNDTDPAAVVVPSDTVTIGAGEQEQSLQLTVNPGTAGTNVALGFFNQLDDGYSVSYGRVVSDTSLLSWAWPVPKAGFHGNTNVTVTIRLTTQAPTGGATLNLSTTNPGVTIPSALVVPEGEVTASFLARANDVSTITGGDVTCEYHGKTLTYSVSVYPTHPREISLSKTRVHSGESVMATVRLNSFVSYDTEVQIEYSHPNAASGPTVVTVPAGQFSVTFMVTAGKAHARQRSCRVRAVRWGIKHGVELLIDP